MAKNQMTVGSGKKQYVDVATLLRNPSQRAKLQNYIDEIVKCKTKILDQQESIKTIRDTAIDEMGIEPKVLGSLINLYWNNNFDQKLEELDVLRSAIEAMMQIGE